ncbi:hypothetical protein [Mycobacteroides abscessus]|nr:hypothetical protein [Mycobacteroides abscessus]SHX64787.1 Uncharacterised protein [Mycobacteroides abscessus subsp. abscessus]SHZ18167.1 Uncharacterised protein [Mycobacteroides abscessus subsp. abscessus]SIB50991.1 Uncharacterised protein [Mycobacteroides abscessus subsp. abscessus]SIF18610.1 Uncharacterised protein [Mycobacteroides abscessus subsp. abscessus]SKI48302.1 Uncharacterised protein [Mycobacteroides abscessus subsp. abscessus]
MSDWDSFVSGGPVGMVIVGLIALAALKMVSLAVRSIVRDVTGRRR